MIDRIETYNPSTINNQLVTPYIDSIKRNSEFNKNGQVLEIINAEGGEDFVNYVEWLGLAGDPDLVVLSAKHHYFYDAEEMKNVRSVLNLKELNHVKNLKGLLRTMFHILPHKSYFIGCFVDNKKTSGFEVRMSRSAVRNEMNSEAVSNGILSRIPFLNMLFSLMDSRTNSYLTKTIAASLIEEHGLKILDMTERSGITYFCAQRIHNTAN